MLQYSENDPRMASVGNLMSMLKASGKKYDIDKIRKAYLYAADLHEGQFRNSGEP